MVFTEGPGVARTGATVVAGVGAAVPVGWQAASVGLAAQTVSIS